MVRCSFWLYMSGFIQKKLTANSIPHASFKCFIWLVVSTPSKNMSQPTNLDLLGERACPPAAAQEQTLSASAAVSLIIISAECYQLTVLQS